MGQDVELRCRCGNVRGRLRDASPQTINRARCYCDDCQAFLHHLGRSDLLDPQGGTDIVQAAPASIRFEQGTSHIAGVRLSPKGMYRWYATCCHTPLGNTMKPSLPFVGMSHEIFVVGADQLDAIFGRPRGAVFGQFAIGTPPRGSTKLNLGMVSHVVGRLLTWKLGGRSWPNPFFERASRAPAYPVATLSRAEREALRAFCGPSPSTTPRATAG